MSRNRFVEYERVTIVGRISVDKKDAEKARKWNLAIDNELGKRRREWTFVPPSNMTIILHRGGLVLSVPHEVGRMILHKRMGKIIERVVTLDAAIEGSFEDVIEAMGLGAAV